MNKRTIVISVMSKTRKVYTLSVPSVRIVCPCCEGERDMECSVCKSNSVITVADEAILSSEYPRIHKAWYRLLDEMEYDRVMEAWEKRVGA